MRGVKTKAQAARGASAFRAYRRECSFKHSMPPELDRITDIRTAIPVLGYRSFSMPQALALFLRFLQFGC
jgi:hypothetical protein